MVPKIISEHFWVSTIPWPWMSGGEREREREREREVRTGYTKKSVERRREDGTKEIERTGVLFY